MKTRKKINTIEDLRMEKEKLKLEMEVTRVMMTKTTGRIWSDAQKFVVRKLLIPIGLSALATFILNQFSKEEAGEKAQQSGESSPLPGILRMAAQFVMDFYQNNGGANFQQTSTHEGKEEEHPA